MIFSMVFATLRNIFCSQILYLNVKSKGQEWGTRVIAGTVVPQNNIFDPNGKVKK